MENKVLEIHYKDLEEVFYNLKIKKQILNSFQDEDESDTLYQKFLSEFVGVYCVLVTLGLEDEWQKWQIQYDINHSDKK